MYSAIHTLKCYKKYKMNILIIKYIFEKNGSDTSDIRIEFLPQCKFQDCYGPFSASLRAASVLRSVQGIVRLTWS